MKELALIHDKKYKYVFCDIFDTIVSRCVHPEYTKKIWANQVIKYFDLNVSMQTLYNKRNELEYKLGQNNKYNGLDWEFHYTDLIKELYKCFDFNLRWNEFLHVCMSLEIEIESNVLVVDENVIQQLKQLRKEGKKVYCVSDMYLSKPMIESIFTNLDIIDFFDNIFVSSEYKLNKKSGKLYSKVLKAIKGKASECIMIGDNYHSDYEMPKSFGIDAIHLDRTENYNRYENFIRTNHESKVEAKLSELIKTNTDNFEHAIFILYQFIEKLYYKLLNDDLNEVFFLSREGEYLKKLFDYYVAKNYGKKIKSHYILVSRKATYLPSLTKLDKEDFSVLLKQYSYVSIKEFLSSLNFSDLEINKILTSYSQECKNIIKNEKLTEGERVEFQSLIDGKYDTKLNYLYDSKILKHLKKNEIFRDIYELNRSEQNKLFKKYIKSFTKSKRICVVDIGWNGSIQNNIQNILGEDYVVTGYLYGLVTRDPKNTKNKEGLIFSNYPQNTENFELFAENKTIFEILLGASHGSANRYVEMNNKVEVLTFEKDEEKKIYTNVISKIQDNMFGIYCELLEILPNGYYDNLKINKIINNTHFNMVFKPTKEQLKFFNKIYHYENFGVFEFTEFKLKDKINLKKYIKESVKFFVKYDSFFYDAFWPVLKLYNEKLYLQRFLYVAIKRIKLKKKGVI